MCVTLTPHRHIDKSGYQEREPTFDFLFATTMQLSVAYKTTTVHRLAFGAVLDLGQIYHRTDGYRGDEKCTYRRKLCRSEAPPKSLTKMQSTKVSWTKSLH